MIQRIQTIFLILVIAGLIAYLLLPFWIKLDPVTGTKLTATPFFMKQSSPGNNEAILIYMPYIFCGIGAILAIGIAFLEIFQFKNRLTQIKLGLVNSILLTLVLFFSAWLCLQAQRDFIPGVAGTFKPGLFAPVAAMIFNSLANRYIKKDEDLVRSADRIR